MLERWARRPHGQHVEHDTRDADLRELGSQHAHEFLQEPDPLGAIPEQAEWTPVGREDDVARVNLRPRRKTVPREQPRADVDQRAQRLVPVPLVDRHAAEDEVTARALRERGGRGSARIPRFVDIDELHARPR